MHIRILSENDEDMITQADHFAEQCYRNAYSHIYTPLSNQKYVATHISLMTVVVVVDDNNIIRSMIMIDIVDEIAIFHRFCSDGTIKGVGFSTVLPFAENIARLKGCTKAVVQVIVHETTRKLLLLYMKNGYDELYENMNGYITDCHDNITVQLKAMMKRLK
jgi:hypothetical protein